MSKSMLPKIKIFVAAIFIASIFFFGDTIDSNRRLDGTQFRPVAKFTKTLKSLTGIFRDAYDNHDPPGLSERSNVPLSFRAPLSTPWEVSSLAHLEAANAKTKADMVEAQRKADIEVHKLEVIYTKSIN